jgi:hypothetical protein
MQTRSFDSLAAALHEVQALAAALEQAEQRLSDVIAMLQAARLRQEADRQDRALHFPPPKPIAIDESPWAPAREGDTQ